jgi:amino acid transporter
MSLADRLLGRRLATSEEGEQRVGAFAAIPMLGLDALGSASYGPEAALTILIPLGALGLTYIGPISIVIILLLLIVYVSYRQTITAYPHGGGSYTVARSNLGLLPGLLAAAALIIDYVLVVAIGISAGVGAVVSAVPTLQPYTLAICLAILALIALINLRGVRESGMAFTIPTYLFIGCMLFTVALGVAKTLLSGAQPTPVVSPPALPPPEVAVSIGLLLHAFASGCTALTGVEAISNGVTVFRAPSVRYARQTLTAVIGILAILLAGIAFLARVYGIGATEPGATGYESVLSQLIGAVAGKGAFYYLSMAAILSVLVLSANTGFADFPRVTRVIAQDDFLPHAFAQRGRRLVNSSGIYVLTFFAGGLLVAFGGITDRLIPLFAVGAFLAFTLSQAGMVVHWRRQGGPHRARNMVVNGLGAIATAITLVVIIAAKFVEGAWITLVVIPALIVIFLAIRRHYRGVASEIACLEPLDTEDLRPPIVIVPIKAWDRPGAKALRFALKVSPDVRAIQVLASEGMEDLRNRWPELVEQPARAANLPPPTLTVIDSPYRQLMMPIIRFIKDIRAQHPNRQLAVIIPDLVEHRWYHYLLHNQQGELLTALLLLQGDEHMVIVNVPWYLRI